MCRYFSRPTRGRPTGLLLMVLLDRRQSHHALTWLQNQLVLVLVVLLLLLVLLVLLLVLRNRLLALVGHQTLLLALLKNLLPPRGLL